MKAMNWEAAIGAFIGFWVLVLLAVGLGFLAVVLRDLFGRTPGILVFIAFCGLCLSLLYGLTVKDD